MSLRPNALLAIALIALVAITGEWADLPGADRYWRLPAGLLLLALAYDAFIARRAGVTLAVRTAARWRLARPEVVELIVSQQTPRSLEVELAPDAPADVECEREIRTLCVPPGTPARLRLQAVARRLGRREWPALRARVAGPFRLAWWPRALRDAAAVAVEPDFLGDPRAVAGADRYGGRWTNRRGAGGEILQLRSYQPGDPLRAIDWKATARGGRLMAREFAEDQHLEVVIGLDVGRSSAIGCGELDRLGHYVNIAARLAERATALDDRVGLVVFGDRPIATLAPGRGTPAVMRIRKLLSSLESQTVDSNPMHAAARIRSLVRRRCLVVLLTEIDGSATGNQLLSAVRLLRPQHLPLIASLRSEALESFVQPGAAGELDPYRALAAGESRVRVERSTAALAALGVVALMATPARLEPALVDAYERFRRDRRV